MNNKIIITSIISFSLVSFIFLSFSEKKQSDINSKNIWMINFQNPKDNSLNFVIENHSNNADFQYKILEDKNVLKQEDVLVAKGETKTIPVSIGNQDGKKKIIEVSNKQNKKEIYKIL